MKRHQVIGMIYVFQRAHMLFGVNYDEYVKDQYLIVSLLFKNR